MIILIRGTNGSGKSHAVRAILAHAKTREFATFCKHGSSIIHVSRVVKPICVVGPYIPGRSMGGSDCMRHKDIYRVIGCALNRGQHVIVENVQIAMRPFFDYHDNGDDLAVLFMDTPIAQCWMHIHKRQKARGRISHLSQDAMARKRNRAHTMWKRALDRGLDSIRITDPNEAPAIILNWLRHA